MSRTGPTGKIFTSALVNVGNTMWHPCFSTLLPNPKIYPAVAIFNTLRDRDAVLGGQVI